MSDRSHRSDAASNTHRTRDVIRDPYPSPYNDAPPPSERELERLQQSMREAKAVLAAWSSQARKGAGSF